MYEPANIYSAGVAVAYPFVSWVLLRVTCGPVGIPHPEHLVFFSYILPIIGVASTVWAKLVSSRLAWVSVAVFAAWLGFMGWFHYWFITSLWDSI